MRECPRCHNEKAYFIGEICGDCHAKGLDLLGGSDGKKGAMPMEFRKEACKKGCGREIGVNQLARHEAACNGEPRSASRRSNLPVRRKLAAHPMPAQRREDGAAVALGAARISAELLAVIEECHRAIDLIRLAARRIEERGGA
ncbi:MAG: hypothetical protein ABSD47_01285 [Candidatus Methylomirabilota bacterium]|jgi:hypothetical protein